MQKCTARDDQELAAVRSAWAEQERAERNLLAQLKQQWLGEIFGIEAQCREIEKSNLVLAKAG